MVGVTDLTYTLYTFLWFHLRLSLGQSCRVSTRQQLVGFRNMPGEYLLVQLNLKGSPLSFPRSMLWCHKREQQRGSLDENTNVERPRWNRFLFDALSMCDNYQDTFINILLHFFSCLVRCPFSGIWNKLFKDVPHLAYFQYLQHSDINHSLGWSGSPQDYQ